MRRGTKLTLLLVVGLMLVPTSAVAQSGTNSTSQGDVTEIINKTDPTIEEVNEVVQWAANESNRAQLSDEQKARASSWLDDHAPEIDIDFGIRQSSKPDGTASAGDSYSQTVNESAVTKVEQIRTGQWIVDKQFYSNNDTGLVEVYSRFDGKLAVVDSNYCTQDMEVCTPPISNADVSGGEITRLWFHATDRNNDQSATLNSLEDATGNYELAITQLSDDDSPLFSSTPPWDYVHIAVLVASLSLAGLALLTYAYIWWSSRRLFENGFEFINKKT